MEATRVFLVSSNFYVLKETHKLSDSPAKLSWVWLNKDQLKDVNNEETAELGLILHDNSACD